MLCINVVENNSNITRFNRAQIKYVNKQQPLMLLSDFVVNQNNIYYRGRRGQEELFI